MIYVSSSVRIGRCAALLSFLKSAVDVIIVEDDPYYFLQQGEYKPKSERRTAAVKHEEDKFLAGLAPSYLKFDCQGRVIRLDTFSKVSVRNSAGEKCIDVRISVRRPGQPSWLVHMQPSIGRTSRTPG